MTDRSGGAAYPPAAFGWNAPSFAEQYPGLPPTEAEHFDLTSKALSRLAVQGTITRKERDRIARRLERQIIAALREAQP